MTVFQILAGGLMSCLAAGETYLQITGKSRRVVSLIRQAVWLAAALFIFFPSATGPLARFLSIGRGADVLLYCTVIAFLLSFFYVIHALERQREQLTYLVRNLALLVPRHVPQPTNAYGSGLQRSETKQTIEQLDDNEPIVSSADEVKQDYEVH